MSHTLPVSEASAQTNLQALKYLQTVGVNEYRVLDAFSQVPREHFVPKIYQKLAYADMEIPLEHDQKMLLPSVQLRIVQSLALQADETVLEIGTGSGYVTALLARLCQHVYSVEIWPELSLQAQRRLNEMGQSNVTFVNQDAIQGWDNRAPYDAIVMMGSVPQFPEHLCQDLKVGGRLVVVVGEAPLMRVVRVTRVAEQEFSHNVLFETCVPVMEGAPNPVRFVF